MCSMGKDNLPTDAEIWAATVTASMSHGPVRVSSKKHVLRYAVQLRDAARLFRRGDDELEDVFQGSVDDPVTSLRRGNFRAGVA